MSGRKRLFALVAAGMLATGIISAATSCGTTLPNRDPTGEMMPSVQGSDLDGVPRTLPGEYRGRPVLLLVGYVQDSQFDIDRWLLGLLQAQTPVQFVEVPTIDGFLPSLFSGRIDDGMRSGIPSEDWGGVLTLYSGEAERVVAMTGNTDPRNARVLLLDAQGLIVWYHDRGYSARVLLELDARVRELRALTER